MTNTCPIEITFHFAASSIEMQNLVNSIRQLPFIRSVRVRSPEPAVMVTILDAEIDFPNTTRDRKKKIGLIVALIKKQLICGDKNKTAVIWVFAGGSGDVTEVRA